MYRADVVFQCNDNGITFSKEGMVDLAEKLMYVTVQVRCELEGGGLSQGTGFIFTYSKGNRSLPVLITNKHVVCGASKTRLAIPYVHTENGIDERRSFCITVDGGEAVWVKHPDDSIDLCALPLQSVFDLMLRHDSEAHHVALDESIIPSQAQLDKLSPFENVIMIGYPIGLIDEVHNAPLMRKGMTATHPRYDYNGQSIFLIGCACFPGSSGSPVFLLDNGPYVEDGVLTFGMQRFKFLGVMFSGPVQRATGEVDVIDIPTTQRLIATTGIPTNLGNVIKARKLTELGDVFWKMAESELAE